MVEARRLLTSAGEQGHAPAQYMLGAMMNNGQGGPTDPEGGFGWIRKAAESGDASAQFEMAQSLRQGRGVKMDLQAAFHAYDAAGRQKHADALFHAGLMIATGEGFDGPDPARAENYYQLAAMDGHDGAAHNLGIMFAKGNGVQQDSKMAIELLEYAISLGNYEAFFSAGLVCAQGDPPDLVAAATWALLSLKHYPEGNGQKLLDGLAPHLPEDAREEAKRRTEAWKREPKTLAWEVRGG